MNLHELVLDGEPRAALERIRSASRERAVLVFKLSPICPVSTRAESELDAWIAELGDESELALARVDVLAQKPLARGLTAELGIDHASPQALWFEAGELRWHDSHGALTRERFGEWLASSS